MSPRPLSAMIVLGLLLAAGPVAAAECTLSDPPKVPDGSTAPKEEMEAAGQAVKQFLAETQEYLACLEFEDRGANSNGFVRKHNQAIEIMEKTAFMFNKELRAFRAR